MPMPPYNYSHHNNDNNKRDSNTIIQAPGATNQPTNQLSNLDAWAALHSTRYPITNTNTPSPA